MIGRQADLLRSALGRTGDVFNADTIRLGLLRGGVLDLGGGDKPDKVVWSLIAETIRDRRAAETETVDRALIVVPLEVSDEVAGVVLAERHTGSFSSHDRRLLDLLAGHVALELDNTRLYRQLDTLLHQFMPDEVAQQLVADPDQAALGGSIRDVTVLFGDLRGFTSYSERSAPDRVVDLLNRYFSAAVPVIINHGGTVTSFIGDALMALFNAPVEQPEHELRAARAGLEMQQVIEGLSGDHGPGRPGQPVEAAPRFRVGINTGPALVGNIGSVQRRTYTAIGDAVNVAARLEGHAEPGEVIIGGATYRALGTLAQVHALGGLQVKGREQPVDAYRLDGLGRPRGLRETMIRAPR